MAELTLTTFLSLDGVMQAPGGPAEDTRGNFTHGGWLVPHADADMGATMVDIFARADAFLLGRKTYDIFAAHWPRVTDRDDPVASKLNTLPKFVASRAYRQFDWHNSTAVADVVQTVADLKQRLAGEVQVHGSGDLAQTLIAHDLIDEYRLLVFPVLLGAGKRLFGAGTAPATLRLVRSHTTGKGTVISVYRRAGTLETGSFALD
ncbi:MAG: dihydrofolate reductase [Denitromonas halophila]|nr:MAG: dihydrofolate reductase [Denitromonas halophila]